MLTQNDISSYMLEINDSKIKISKLSNDKWICTVNISMGNGKFLCNDNSLKTKFSFKGKMEDTDNILFDSADDAYLSLIEAFKNEDNKNKEDEIIEKVYSDSDLEIEDIVKIFHKKDRIPFKLDNNSVIIVCKPCIGYEKHSDDLKERRTLFEYNYWKKLTEANNHSKYKIANVMIKHPLFKNIK